MKFKHHKKSLFRRKASLEVNLDAAESATIFTRQGVDPKALEALGIESVNFVVHAKSAHLIEQFTKGEHGDFSRLKVGPVTRKGNALFVTIEEACPGA